MEEREVTNLVLGVAIAVATLTRLPTLRTLPGWRLLLGAGACLLVAWTATVVEHLALPVVFNTVEHVAYGSQSVLLALWAWQFTAQGGSSQA